MLSSILIFGISSGIGANLATRFMRKGVAVIGTYRKPNSMIIDLEKAARVHNWSLRTIKLDVSKIGDVRKVLAEMTSEVTMGRSPIGLVYCCGEWHCGSVKKLTGKDVDRVLTVGLKAPMEIISASLAIFSGGIRAIIVTGIGGYGRAVRYISLYNVVTTGIYNFVHSTGLELSGSESSCMAVALGLVDNGQPYLKELRERIGVNSFVDLEEVTNSITALMLQTGCAMNGSVLELAGGLENYSEVARYLCGMNN